MTQCSFAELESDLGGNAHPDDNGNNAYTMKFNKQV